MGILDKFVLSFEDVKFKIMGKVQRAKKNTTKKRDEPAKEKRIQTKVTRRSKSTLSYKEAQEALTRIRTKRKAEKAKRR